jgi:NAD(P)H-nitrite reductase large subunit
MENDDEEILKIMSSARPRYLCTCHLIKEEEIIKAIHDGIKDLTELTFVTKASTKCGSCFRNLSNIYYREMEIIEENKDKL